MGINVTCAEIQTPVGFLFVILPVILNHTNNPDCEQSWYLQDGRLIADPANPQKLNDPVISVSSDRLVTSRCVNLNHQIICDSTGFSRVTAYRVRNETAVTPNSDDLNEVTPDLKLSDQFRRHLALLSIAFLLLLMIIILICLMWRRRVSRSFQNADYHWDIEYSENRYPEAAVGKKLRSDAPDSLNQSEQFNGTFFKGKSV